LDAGLLVVGDDRHRVARLLLRCDCGILQELHLAINAQHLGHFFRKLGIALLQVIAHLVRLHLLLIENLANRALRLPYGSRQPVYAPYVEHVPPDTTAAIFWLKNRDPAHWRDTWQMEHLAASTWSQIGRCPRRSGSHRRA
jgi:hypothetical protein